MSHSQKKYIYIYFQDCIVSYPISFFCPSEISLQWCMDFGSSYCKSWEYCMFLDIFCGISFPFCLKSVLTYVKLGVK
jgi:hypothetical protein